MTADNIADNTSEATFDVALFGEAMAMLIADRPGLVSPFPDEDAGEQ